MQGALRYVEKGSSIALAITSLSNGTQRFLQLLYYIMKFAKNKSGILLIYEIKQFLHNELVNAIKIGLITITKKYDLQVILLDKKRKDKINTNLFKTKTKKQHH